MSGWIAQPGYPVLNVNVLSDRKTVVISQRKFLRNNADHEDKTLWHIPITYASDKQNIEFNETKAEKFIGVDSLKIVLDEAIEWIVFNVQQTGWCFNVEFKYSDLISLLTLYIILKRFYEISIRQTVFIKCYLLIYQSIDVIKICRY